MLSGQITKTMAKDTVEELLFNLSSVLLKTMETNLELYKEGRLELFLNDEQVELANTIVKNSDTLRDLFLSVFEGENMNHVLSEYVELADLEKRGW